VGMARTDAHDELAIVEGRIPRGAGVTWPLPHTRYDASPTAGMHVLAPGMEAPQEPAPQAQPEADISFLSWKDLVRALVRKVGRRVIRHSPAPLRDVLRKCLHRIGRALRLTGA
jgi:hypothetical protein